MTAVPEPVLSALDRLNAHARASGCGKRAIYAYKTAAAVALALAGELEARPFRIGVKCHKCDGTGTFVYWDGEQGGRCRGCGGTGIAVLKFIEGRQTGTGRVWHHPVEHLSYPVLTAAWGIADTRYSRTGHEPDYWILASGEERRIEWGPPPPSWAPNRPGERLSGDDAAKLLNIVETWILDALLDEFYWLLAAARREMRRYRLALDRAQDVCFLCGTAEDLDTVRMGGSGSKFLDFSRAICKADRAAMEAPGGRPTFPREPDPDWITSPVLAWLERHQALGFDPGDPHYGW